MGFDVSSQQKKTKALGRKFWGDSFLSASHLPTGASTLISHGSTSPPSPYGSTSPSISPGERQDCRPVPLRLSFSCSSSGDQVVDMVWKGLLPSEPSHQPLYLNLPTKRFWCPSAAGKHQTLLAVLQSSPHTILHIARDLWIFVFPPESHGKVPVPAVGM